MGPEEISKMVALMRLMDLLPTQFHTKENRLEIINLGDFIVATKNPKKCIIPDNYDEILLNETFLQGLIWVDFKMKKIYSRFVVRHPSGYVYTSNSVVVPLVAF